MKTIALESVDFFQREWNCLEKHEDSDSMSRVVQIDTVYQERSILRRIKRCLEPKMWNGLLGIH